MEIQVAPPKDNQYEELAMLEEELVRRGRVPPKVDRGTKWKTSYRFQKFQRTYWEDPLAFAHDCIEWEDGEKPTHYQDHALGEFVSRQRIAMWGPRGLGKTSLMAILTWWGLLTANDVKLPITAGSFRQLEKFLWPEIRKWWDKIKWDYIGRPKPQDRTEVKLTDITLSDTALTITASPRDAGKFEGAHARDRVLAIFDESKEIEDDVFDSVEGSFSKVKQPLAIAASTPGIQMGRFYDICRGSPGYHDWYQIHVTKDDMVKAGFMDEVWAENRRLQWGNDSPKYLNHIEGEFANDDPSVIIPFHWVSKAKERWLDLEAEGQLPSRPNRIGVDCAWGGEDRTVICLAYNNVVLSLHPYDYKDTVKTAGQVIMIARYNKDIPIVVDVIGWGAGVHDSLKNQGYNVIAFNAGAKSALTENYNTDDIEFLNNRAASWYKTWQLFDPNYHDPVAIPDHELLDVELSTPKWKPTQSGKYQVEGKHDIRRRMKGRSTDHADSAIMSFIADDILEDRSSKTTVAVVTYALNRGVPQMRIA